MGDVLYGEDGQRELIKALVFHTHVSRCNTGIRQLKFVAAMVNGRMFVKVREGKKTFFLNPFFSLSFFPFGFFWTLISLFLKKRTKRHCREGRVRELHRSAGVPAAAQPHERHHHHRAAVLAEEGGSGGHHLHRQVRAR